MADRNWKEAKPKWVVEDALAEMAIMRELLALRWPTEAEPKGLFGFGEYDCEWGTVELGEFWVSNGVSVERTFIREKLEAETGWKKIRFSQNGDRFHDSVSRGHYFRSRKDAALRTLWHQCRRHARELSGHWAIYEESE